MSAVFRIDAMANLLPELCVNGLFLCFGLFYIVKPELCLSISLIVKIFESVTKKKSCPAVQTVPEIWWCEEKIGPPHLFIKPKSSMAKEAKRKPSAAIVELRYRKPQLRAAKRAQTDGHKCAQTQRSHRSANQARPYLGKTGAATRAQTKRGRIWARPAQP